jgi:hypothetical protein
MPVTLACMSLGTFLTRYVPNLMLPMAPVKLRTIIARAMQGGWPPVRASSRITRLQAVNCICSQ